MMEGVTKILIKSKYKDYYDHIAHIYGGGDPKITYVRNRLAPLCKESGADFGFSIKDYKGDIRDGNLLRYQQHLQNNYCSQWCVVAGKYYLLVGKTVEEMCVLNEKDHPEVWEYLFRKKGWGDHHPSDHYIGSEPQDSLVELSRLVGAPVFTIRGMIWNWAAKTYDLVIDSNIPVLSKLGFPAIVPPEQMYQDIAYYIGNKIHASPDLEPPAKVSDKDRIVQHGFDLRTSFRHPVR